MNYEESKLLSLLKKQDIDNLFLEATNYLCQIKSLLEEKEQLQQENERQEEVINKTKKAIQDMIHYGYIVPNLESNCAEYFFPQDENTYFGARAKELLKILENKEK